MYDDDDDAQAGARKDRQCRPVARWTGAALRILELPRKSAKAASARRRTPYGAAPIDGGLQA